jgi:hypothetical protein
MREAPFQEVARPPLPAASADHCIDTSAGDGARALLCHDQRFPPAEIVDRYSAGTKQLINTNKPPLAAFANLEHTSRCLPQRNQGAD